MRGEVFDIRHGCTNDGPGIRTVVFLKGCPLHCVWCHNPESQSHAPEMLFSSERCALCGRCVALCPSGAHAVADGVHRYDRERCMLCGKCLRPHCGALCIAGREAEHEEILREVEKDKPFYGRSGGGMTLSGGEPLAQPDFCSALLKGAKERGLHTAIETSGFASSETLERVAPYADLFLYDFKESDPDLHRRYTGQDNALILQNLFFLDNSGKAIVLRCPIIPGYNDRADHFDGIARAANRLKNLRAIEIEPYHSFGEGKYPALGRTDVGAVRPVKDGEPELWRRAIREKANADVRLA